MDLSLFAKTNAQLKAYTNDIAYHVVGDPLLVPNIREYLDISYDAGLNVHITTAGYYLKENHAEILNHPSIKQINFSLNSYRGNALPISLDAYLQKIADFTLAFRAQNAEAFINYRLWNIDMDNSQQSYNESVINAMFAKLGAVPPQMQLLTQTTTQQRLRVIEKVLFNFDTLFEWPSLEAAFVSDRGTCHGLSAQMAISSSGEVVPCCFDYEAVINLGNVKEQRLEEILQTQRAKELLECFKQGILTEELCKHCSYRIKFDTP
jgi:radical SAM protein with 4Fe4S-binding SPASM domain